MSERNLRNCDRYLDRIAQLVDRSKGHERAALLSLAGRLMREMEEAREQADVAIRLAERLKDTP